MEGAFIAALLRIYETSQGTRSVRSLRVEKLLVAGRQRASSAPCACRVRPFGIVLPANADSAFFRNCCYLA